MLKLQHCFWADELSQAQTQIEAFIWKFIMNELEAFYRTVLVLGQINACCKLCWGGSIAEQKDAGGGGIGTRIWTLSRKTGSPGSVWTSRFLITRAPCFHLWETVQHMWKILLLSWYRREKQTSATITLLHLDGLFLGKAETSWKVQTNLMQIPPRADPGHSFKWKYCWQYCGCIEN